MDCTQDPGLLVELMDLGALPCFGIGLIGLLLIKLIVYMMTKDIDETRDTEADAIVLIASLLGVYFLALFICICIFAGFMSIFRDLATSQPIH